MRTLPTREALVQAYWRKLASSIEAAYKGHARVIARRARGALQTHRRRSRHNDAAKAVVARQNSTLTKQPFGPIHDYMRHHAGEGG
jgi:hypothetical protein